MNKDTICLSSKTIDIAENETYLELTNRVCYYDEPNLNNAMLPSDGAEERAETLVNMPVVAKYRVSSKGDPTFGSHEMYIDEDGEVAFATDNIGTHTEVYIEEDTVDVNGIQKNLPCLFAKYRVWKRNKNVIAAIRRLYSENKLFSSWEIATSAYEFKDGIKKITDYVFLSNALLGFEYASPAYGKDAKAISLSTNESQLLIAEALSHDILDGLNIENSTEKEDVDLKKNKVTEVSEEVLEEATETTTKNIENETVEETEAQVDSVENTDNEENDSEKTTDEISELKEKISELNSAIETKNDAIVKASEEIQTLKTQVSELSTYKEKFEEAEQERIENEIAEKKQNLVSKYEKSGLITKDEFETSEEVKGYIDSLDEKSLKELVATRYMASLETENVEVSEVKEQKQTTTTSANLLDDGVTDDKVSVMKQFLRK